MKSPRWWWAPWWPAWSAISPSRSCLSFLKRYSMAVFVGYRLLMGAVILILLATAVLKQRDESVSAWS